MLCEGGTSGRSGGMGLLQVALPTGDIRRPIGVWMAFSAYEYLYMYRYVVVYVYVCICLQINKAEAKLKLGKTVLGAGE